MFNKIVKRYKDILQYNFIYNMSKKQIIEKGSQLSTKSNDTNPKPNMVTSLLKNLQEKMLYDGKEVHTYLVNGVVYFKGKEIAEILEYTNTREALRQKVSINNKSKLIDLIRGSHEILPLTLSSNEKSSIVITEQGIYELVTKSKMPEAKKFQHWICNELLPQIRKTGEYKSDDIKLEYMDENITNYDNKNVLYFADVGNYDNERLIKYGGSGDVFRRVYNEHRIQFDTFKLLNVYETDNDRNIEKMFKKELKSRELSRSMLIKGKMQTELFSLIDNSSYVKMQSIMTELIKNNPLKALEDANAKIEKLENNTDFEKFKITEQTKQKELETEQIKEQEKTRQVEEKTKQMELEIKLLELKYKYGVIQPNNVTEKEIKDNPIDDIDDIDEIDNKDYKENIYKDKFDHFLQTETEYSTTGVHITTLFNYFNKWHDKTYPDDLKVHNVVFRNNIQKYKNIVDGIYEKTKGTVGRSVSTGIRNLNIKFDPTIYLDYVKLYVVRQDGCFISWKNLREHFISWHKSKKYNVPLQSQTKVRDNFEKHIFKMEARNFNYKRNQFYGWKDYKLQI